ncbi:adenylate kinase isoenzyme 5-like [Epinephelus moara]|uniref:adenylate kinase isoenzyme 5-like n=1 Tax=Epinephelus moara TaxID=300413 RepID=UPI00214DFE2C|nr:adenylate kinase isoenzyme 5-like [Epinephelus moara]
MSSSEMKEYLCQHHLPQLLESLLTGVLYHHPDDPVSFLQSCLIRTRQLGGPEAVTWDTFIQADRRQLSPTPFEPAPEPPRTNKTFQLYNIPNNPNNTSNSPYNTTNPHNKPHTLYNITNTSNNTINTPHNSTMTPSVHSVRKDEGDTKTFITIGPPSGPPPPRVQSQVSIDSDSDMTETSGLLQEVSITPPQRPRPLIIFIIGGPASGKGSQAARLAHYFRFRVVSLDELLRRQLLSPASPSKKWEVLSEMMGHGELEPQVKTNQEETVSELSHHLIGQKEVRGVIVDGFPQDIHQALSFQEQIGSPDLVVLLLCSNQTLRCRLQKRAALLGLLGDNSSALRRRLETFQRDIVSTSRYYRQLHLLIQVDADREEDVVLADLCSAIRGKLCLQDVSDPADDPECSSSVPVTPKTPV